MAAATQIDHRGFESRNLFFLGYKKLFWPAVHNPSAQGYNNFCSKDTFPVAKGTCYSVVPDLDLIVTTVNRLGQVRVDLLLAHF